MKKKYIIITLFIVTSAGIFAQSQDSLLSRQMELRREFNPTLQDADKINSLPAVPQPTIRKANTAYSGWAGKTTPPLEIAMPQPADIMTEIPYNREKGYITLRAGNYANISGALGYRIIDKEKSSLSFNFLHDSSNGNIAYSQTSDPQSGEAYFADNTAALTYKGLFDAFRLDLAGGYAHSGFNYYGNTFGGSRIFENKKQTLGVFNFGFAFESTKSERFNYRGHLDYRNFSTRYGSSLAETGLRGNHFDALFGIDKPFGERDARVGIDGKFSGVFHNGGISDFALTGGTPYVAFEGANWRARLGANVLCQILGGAKFRVTPDIELRLNVTDHSSLYADIKGGIDDNTFLNMMSESRYLAPMTSVKSSSSLIDIQAGAKIGEISGFRFDIFGGFGKIDDEHFLILQNTPSGSVSGRVTHEVLVPIYGNLSHSHVGARIQSTVWAPLDVALQAKKNFHAVKDSGIADAKAYNKPGLEADIKATFEATKNLKFIFDYYFAGDRWSYFNGANVKMNNINDLNLGVFYSISRSFSVNVKANNLLSQKYDIWYGYPAQGFNAMGGFTFLF